jgi:SAM-dependent methyltransferase
MTWDPKWEQVFRSQPWGKYPGEDLIRFVARNFYRYPDRHAVRILEVGCGTGTNLWYVAREGFTALGVEGSETAVALARERLSAECPGWDAPPRSGRIEVADILQLPFPDDSCDAVIDHEAVYCNSYEDSQRIYAEMYRVTRPGGRLFVRTFASGSWGDGIGHQVGPRAYIADAGPLAGKGYSRFTSREELPDLLGPWRIGEVNLITRTLEGGRQQLLEWIVEAVKAHD